ncbi:MAG: hypothetical protein Q8O68_01490 [Candidatus Daviesbacteria bacterium]|nr:hypothetical protein [Candidatus Daviesbacteria bacterium]
MLKHLTKKKIIFAFIILLALGFTYIGLYFGFVPSILGLEKEVARYNTVYMENFSWEKLGQVKKGMTKQEVIEILGEPYHGLQGCPGWSYGNPNPWKRIPPLAEDFWYVTAQVCFDETGKVSYPGVENVFFN